MCNLILFFLIIIEGILLYFYVDILSMNQIHFLNLLKMIVI